MRKKSKKISKKSSKKLSKKRMRNCNLFFNIKNNKLKSGNLCGLKNKIHTIGYTKRKGNYPYIYYHKTLQNLTCKFILVLFI